jgi:hypothetical protein
MLGTGLAAVVGRLAPVGERQGQDARHQTINHRAFGLVKPAVAPGLGGDPAAAPRLDRRLPRSEQAADQLDALLERRSIGRSPAGEFGLDLVRHPRQRLRARAGPDSRCDRSVDGRDLSPADTKLDRWTSSQCAAYQPPLVAPEAHGWKSYPPLSDHRSTKPWQKRSPSETPERCRRLANGPRS